jgi:hypothetical protein
MRVIAAYDVQCLAAGCQGSGAEQQAVSPGRGMLHDGIVGPMGPTQPPVGWVPGLSRG